MIYSEASASQTLVIGMFLRTLRKVCQGRAQPRAASGAVTKKSMYQQEKGAEIPAPPSLLSEQTERENKSIAQSKEQ